MSATSTDQAGFTIQELHNLQLLFMIIDRTEDGLISKEELIQWSQEEGEFLSETQADRCIESVDMDGDGQIGLDDYLWFASLLKQQALQEEMVVGL